MRILITLPWAERLGGAEAMLQAILDGAADSGHELELVFFQRGPWPDELGAAGLRVEVIPAGRVRQAHRWLATVLRLSALMRRRQPDLILNWAAKTQLYGAPAALLAGMAGRVVWWQQNIPSGHWVDRCATLLPARAIGCYSQAAARAQQRLWPRRATFVVAAGAPVPRVNGGPPLELATDAPVVGIVGRLQPWKGQDRLLAAQALLRDRGHELHLVIVGGDAYGLSTEYAQSLAPLAERLGLAGHVTFTGQVPDAGPYIERLDVLVNASDPEPFGIVLLEGMARGVPVLAVDSGGPSEFIEDRRTGALAKSGEPGALADALESLLGSSELRRAIGEAGRERFLQEFTDGALRRRFFGQLEALAPDRPQDPCAVTIVAHDVGSVGGMERQLAELVLGLRQLGHPVTVIGWTCELPSAAGVVFHRVRGPRRPFLLGYPAFMLAGSLAVRRHRRGVVQSTGAIVLNRLDSVAIHCCHQVYRAAPRRATRPFRAYVRLLGAVKRLAERLCVRANRPGAFVCVSEGVAEEMRQHHPAVADRVLTIHNGVDTRAFAPGAHVDQARALRARLGISSARLVAVFVARDWGHKGLGPVIEALAGAPDWDLVVAGEGDRPHYAGLAESEGVAARVHWLGVVADIHIVYALGDAFVLPSSYETFSLVTFEAAASGLPVLATPVSGVRELLVDGQNGFAITREPSSIAACLNRLAADATRRRAMGEAARQAARTFTWERMVREHHELYTRLVGSRAAG